MAMSAILPVSAVSFSSPAPPDFVILGNTTEVAFVQAAPLLVVGVAARLLAQSNNKSEYARNEAAIRKKFHTSLQFPNGLPESARESAQRAFEGFLSSVKKIKFSPAAPLNQFDQIHAAVRGIEKQLRALLLTDPSKTAGQLSRPELSTFEQKLVDSIRSIAQQLKSKAQAGRPLSVQQLAQDKLGQQLRQLQQYTTQLLESRSQGLSRYRTELQQLLAQAQNHGAGLYRLSVHKALAGTLYTPQALRNLHAQASKVMKEPGDATLLQQLSELLRRRAQPPSKLNNPKQEVNHTSRRSHSASDVNARWLKERAEKIEQAAREAHQALKNRLPAGDPEQILKDVAEKYSRYGITVTSLKQAIKTLSTSSSSHHGATRASATGAAGGSQPLMSPDSELYRLISMSLRLFRTDLALAVSFFKYLAESGQYTSVDSISQLQSQFAHNPALSNQILGEFFLDHLMQRLGFPKLQLPWVRKELLARLDLPHIYRNELLGLTQRSVLQELARGNSVKLPEWVGGTRRAELLEESVRDAAASAHHQEIRAWRFLHSIRSKAYHLGAIDVTPTNRLYNKVITNSTLHETVADVLNNIGIKVTIGQMQGNKVVLKIEQSLNFSQRMLLKDIQTSLNNIDPTIELMLPSLGQ